jgi:hypothetical protein
VSRVDDGNGEDDRRELTNIGAGAGFGAATGSSLPEEKEEAEKFVGRRQEFALQPSLPPHVACDVALVKTGSVRVHVGTSEDAAAAKEIRLRALHESVVHFLEGVELGECGKTTVVTLQRDHDNDDAQQTGQILSAHSKGMDFDGRDDDGNSGDAPYSIQVPSCSFINQEDSNVFWEARVGMVQASWRPPSPVRVATVAIELEALWRVVPDRTVAALNESMELVDLSPPPVEPPPHSTSSSNTSTSADRIRVDPGASVEKPGTGGDDKPPRVSGTNATMTSAQANWHPAHRRHVDPSHSGTRGCYPPFDFHAPNELNLVVGVGEDGAGCHFYPQGIGSCSNNGKSRGHGHRRRQDGVLLKELDELKQRLERDRDDTDRLLVAHVACWICLALWLVGDMRGWWRSVSTRWLKKQDSVNRSPRHLAGDRPPATIIVPCRTPLVVEAGTVKYSALNVVQTSANDEPVEGTGALADTSNTPLKYLSGGNRSTDSHSKLVRKDLVDDEEQILRRPVVGFNSVLSPPSSSPPRAMARGPPLVVPVCVSPTSELKARHLNRLRTKSTTSSSHQRASLTPPLMGPPLPSLARRRIKPSVSSPVASGAGHHPAHNAATVTPTRCREVVEACATSTSVGDAPSFSIKDSPMEWEGSEDDRNSSLRGRRTGRNLFSGCDDGGGDDDDDESPDPPSQKLRHSSFAAPSSAFDSTGSGRTEHRGWVGRREPRPRRDPRASIHDAFWASLS